MRLVSLEAQQRQAAFRLSEKHRKERFMMEENHRRKKAELMLHHHAEMGHKKKARAEGEPKKQAVEQKRVRRTDLNDIHGDFDASC